MKRIILGIISIATLALSLACNGAGNYNGNANANGNANRAVTNANANANVSTSPRAGVTREDVERDRERYQREAKGQGRTVGAGANDLWLWVKTRFDLAAADDLRDSTINVDVDNDVVTLTGTVANAAQRGRAEAVAKSVEGVRSVRNQLKVAPSGSTNANTK